MTKPNAAVHSFSEEDELQMLLDGHVHQYSSLVEGNFIEFPRFPLVREFTESHEKRLDDRYILLSKFVAVSQSALSKTEKEKILSKLIKCKNLMVSLLERNVKFPTVTNYEIELQNQNRAGINFTIISEELNALRTAHQKIKHGELKASKIFGKNIDKDVALAAIEKHMISSELAIREGITLNLINLNNYHSLLSELFKTGKDLNYVSDEQIWRERVYGKLDEKAAELAQQRAQEEDLKDNSFSLGNAENLEEPIVRSFFVDNKEIGVIQDCRSYKTPELMYSYLESKTVFGAKGQRIRSNQFTNEVTKKILNAQQVKGSTWQHVEVKKNNDFTHYKFTLDLAGPAKLLAQNSDVYADIETQLIVDPSSRNKEFIKAANGLSDEERALLGEFAEILNENQKDHIIANYAERLLMSEWCVDSELSEEYGQRIVALISGLTERNWIGGSESFTRRRRINGDDIQLKFKHRTNDDGKIVGLQYELERNGKVFFSGVDTGVVPVNDLIEQLSGVIEPFNRLDISTGQRIEFVKSLLGDDLAHLSLHEILLKKSDYEFNNKLLVAATGIPNYPYSESTDYQVLVEISWLFGLEKRWNNPFDMNNVLTSKLRGIDHLSVDEIQYPKAVVYDKANLEQNRGYDLDSSTLVEKVKLWRLVSNKGFLYAINSELPIKLDFGDIGSVNRQSVVAELNGLPNIEYVNGPRMLIESYSAHPTPLKAALSKALVSYSMMYFEIPNAESKFISARYGNDTELKDISSGFRGYSGMTNIPVVRARDGSGKLVSFPFDWKFSKSESHLDIPAYRDCAGRVITSKSSIESYISSPGKLAEDQSKAAIVEDLLKSGFGTTVYSDLTKKWYVISREIYDTGAFRWQSFDSALRDHKTFNRLSDVVDHLVEIKATKICPRDTFDKNILQGLSADGVIHIESSGNRGSTEWTPEEQALAEDFTRLIGESLGKSQLSVTQYHLEAARGLLRKDPYAIEHISNGLNPSLIELFERHTGINLPKKQVDIWHSVLEWGGVSKEEDLLRKSREDLQREEIRLEKLITNASQVKSHFKSLVADGYTEIIVRDRKRYLFNPSTERGIDLSRKGQGLTKVQAYLGSLLAVNKAEIAAGHVSVSTVNHQATGRFGAAQEFSNVQADIGRNRAVVITDNIAQFNQLLIDDVRSLFREDEIFSRMEPKTNGLDFRFFAQVDESKNELLGFCAGIYNNGQMIHFIQKIEDFKDDFVDVVSEVLASNPEINDERIVENIVSYRHKEVQLGFQF